MAAVGDRGLCDLLFDLFLIDIVGFLLDLDLLFLLLVNFLLFLLFGWVLFPAHSQYFLDGSQFHLIDSCLVLWLLLFNFLVIFANFLYVNIDNIIKPFPQLPPSFHLMVDILLEKIFLLLVFR